MKPVLKKGSRTAYMGSSTKIWNPDFGNGNGTTETEAEKETETDAEYGILERGFQAID